MSAGVYLTFDVECSMGGAWSRDDLEPIDAARGIMGDYGGRRLGLPRICDILEEAGLAATFFVEPFLAEQGHPGQMEGVCQFLLDRGQDVQLHVHPNHRHYALHKQGLPFQRTDDLADLPPDAQRELLAEGARRIEQWTGRRPAAFRAGNMAADETSLEQLAAVGLRIDSSYTFPFLGGQCRFADRQAYNGSKWYGQVLEVALSGFYQPRIPGLHRAKPVDPVGVCFGECRDAITAICGAGAEAVVILHSFSLFKVRDIQYNGGRPDRIVTRRFRRLCHWLAANAGQYPVRTFAQLAEAVEAGSYQARAVPPPTLRRPLRAVVRKAVQAANRFYWF